MWAASVRLRGGAALRRAATGRPSLLRHCTTLPAGTTLRVQAKGAGDGVGVVSGATPQVVSGATTPTPSPSEQLLRELKALYWQAVVGAVAAVTGVAVATVAVQNWWQERSETIANTAADVLLKSKVDDVMELSEAVKKDVLVPRPRLAVALTGHLEKSAYAVVEGPRGTGKTTGVLLALCGKPGVLRVKMTSEFDACVAIAKALRMPNADTMTQTILEDVLVKTRTSKGGRPTIVAEFSRNKNSDAYGKGQVGVLKELCVDKGLVNVVIVLSDADAAFAMPKDSYRQNKIWVDDFNEVDAHTYLDNLGAPELRDELFYQAGTRPLHLLRAAETGFTEFIEFTQGDAQKEIRALLHLEGPTEKSSGPAFKQLIIDLLENTRDGWSLQGFDESAENLGLPSSSTDEYLTAPEVVADLYKTKCHAVLYHQSSDTWRFHSTSHRRAAERMFPEAAARGAAAAVAQSAAAAAKSRPDST